MSASSFDLKSAFGSVKDTYDGTHEESNLTLQRALFQTRVRERRQKLTRWVVLPIAAVLVASTAFAGVRGGLVPAVKSAIESIHSSDRLVPRAARGTQPAKPTLPAPTPPEPAPSLERPAPAPIDLPAPPMPSPKPATKAADPISRATTMGKLAPTAPPVGAAPPLAPAIPSPASAIPSASARRATPPASPPVDLASDPSGPLYAEAHRLHFVARDPARALVAWDRYLATGSPARFAPEARYNRALTLVRLGRREEAKRELGAFASGAYGDYRQREAKALLDALDGAR